MTGVLDTVRDHPISVAAASLIIALPGTYLYITGKLPYVDAPAPAFSPAATISRALSVYDREHPLDLRLALPLSKWSDRPTTTFIVQVFRDAKKRLFLFLTAVGERLGLNARRLIVLLEDRWVSHFPLSRLVSVAVATALPGAFLLFVRHHPGSWAAKHQRGIANALHVFALVTVANQRLSVQDLLVTALVMYVLPHFEVSFEALQRTLSHDPQQAPPAFETLLSQTHTVVAKSDITGSPERRNTIDRSAQIDSAFHFLAADSNDEEIVRLQRTLAEAKTAERAKEHDLKRTQNELSNARETLNETFSEYTSLRDELKTMKQTLGRDHQAVVYRKDIELFALRKGNEQKESYIKDREAKLEDIHRQHRVSLELKDAHIRNLKERIAFLERQKSPKINGDAKVDSVIDGDSQNALAVKLLRVKGRNSSEVERTAEEKDAEIERLRVDLAKAVTTTEAAEKMQDELCRAWDASFEVQNTLTEERESHAQTQNKLQEAVIRLDEELRRSQKNSPTRLPTIEEQDKNELESIFNTAQQDNLRLYAQVDALDKRVREANSRLFSAEQEAEALREKLRLEKAINDDMETARPSVVHRVHFQRMEGQLKESQDALAVKDEEIAQLKETLSASNSKVNNGKETISKTQSELHEENERLKRSITELEATKEQLMLDHERLASQRARQRNSSAENTSARSSGATLYSDSPTHIVTSDEPLPARPVSMGPDGSIQGTPERHLRSDATPNRLSMISNDVPPPELRAARRKSLTLKGFMRKLTGKDGEGEVRPEKPGKGDMEKDRPKTAKTQQKEIERPKTVLMPKDKNAKMRPKTAMPTPVMPLGNKAVAKDRNKVKDNDKTDLRPKTAGVLEKVAEKKTDKEGSKSTSTRYYTTKAEQDNARPKTAAPAGNEDKKAKEDGDKPATAVSGIDTARPKSRGWGSTRKLVRKSIA